MRTGDNKPRATGVWHRRLLLALLAGCMVLGSRAWAQAPAKAATDEVLPVSVATEAEKAIIADAAKNSEIMTNLTYLSDVIGPRLTGSPNLKRANEWTAAVMKKYGLENVNLEGWTIPEGWERGTAHGRVLEPDNGRTIHLASMGWYPGTNGKIQGDVVIIKASTAKELEAYKGKLKNAIVLSGQPTKLVPVMEIEKSRDFGFGGPFGGKGKFKGAEKGDFKKSFEEMRALQAERSELLRKEGVAALLQDANKHHNLLFTTGSWSGRDRQSAQNRLPTAYVAHDHYEMLYRLASRPNAKTRMEIELTNKFIPGPVAVHNTVGEIRGSEKPDEFVVLGAHLDSWDLGQGTIDNGTGSMVVLEAARILNRLATKPKRTIRFILFTGEEQGLHGSREYVQKHKDDMARTSAAIVHDTGTGKVIGLGWAGRTALKPVLEKELAVLKELGVSELLTRGGGGSDHMSFESAGVPSCIFKQEVAGYRFGHHSNADTLTMAREPDLIQGAQVMAITAWRFANMDQLLPRGKE